MNTKKILNSRDRKIINSSGDRIVNSDAVSRRNFLKNTSVISVATALGMTIPYARFMPVGFIPAAFAAENTPDAIEGKEDISKLIKEYFDSTGYDFDLEEEDDFDDEEW